MLGFDTLPALKSRSPSALTYLALLVLALLMSCDDPKPESTRKAGHPRVESVQVEAQTIATSRAWPGTVEPMRVYEIMAPENGRVETFPIQVGDTISAGDLLAQMRFPDADARKADLEARLLLLKAEQARLRNLVERGSVSEATVADAEIASLAARAELRGIEALLGEGEIRAPSDGRVLETRVVAGSSIVEETVLARIADVSSMGIRLHIPNSEVHYFDDPNRLQAITSDGQSHTIHRIIHHGSVGANATQIECWLDPATATSPGTAKIQFHSEREALVIPWSSIANDDDRHWVARLDDENRIERREIQTGETTGTRVEVSAGLEKGDRVLLYQPRSHGEGSTVDSVRPREATATKDDE